MIVNIFPTGSGKNIAISRCSSDASAGRYAFTSVEFAPEEFKNGTEFGDLTFEDLWFIANHGSYMVLDEMGHVVETPPGFRATAAS